MDIDLGDLENIEDAPSIFQEKLTADEQAIFLTLTKEKINEYQEVFEIFDNTGDGKISEDEIGQVMTGLGENPTPDRIKKMIREIDYDADGEVDFDEFICLMVKTLNDADKAEEELVEVFNKFDQNGDGNIDANDLKVQFANLGYEIDDQEAAEMVTLFDIDNDNEINFTEFVKLMMYDTNDPSVRNTDS